MLINKNKLIKDKFNKYIIYNVWLQDLKKMKSQKKWNSTSMELNDKIREWKNYNQQINKILDLMPPDYSSLLKSIYIEKKPKEELFYSESTYYRKHKKAIDVFLNYFEFYDHK